MSEPRGFQIKLPGHVPVPVWANDDDEALEVALGVLETDGALYRRGGRR